jgi:hypothetical protein
MIHAIRNLKLLKSETREKYSLKKGFSAVSDYSKSKIHAIRNPKFLNFRIIFKSDLKLVKKC